MDFRSLLLEAGMVENNNWNPRKARWYTGELLDQVQAHFETVVGYKAASISEAAYFCYHGMEALPSCLKCASPVKKYVCFADGYRDYCSVKCAKSDPKIIEQTKKTSMDRYGVSNVSKSSKIKEKRSETMKERYGDEVYYRTEDFKEKSKATLIDRYGVEHQMHLEEVKNKIKETNLERYGVENPMANAAVYARSVDTNLMRYGFDNPLNSPVIQEKIKETNLKRYGSENPWGNRDIIARSSARREAIFDEKWGGHPSQRYFSEETKKILSDDFVSFMEDKSVSSAADMLGISVTTVCGYCHKHGIVLPASSYETEIAAFLSENGINFIMNSRSVIKPKELDFYLPDQKIGIEFNGLYWHSEDRLGKHYHKEKYEACEAAGIRLLMINEDEWIDRKDAIKGKILNLCGRSEKGVGGRKLRIEKIDNPTAHRFVDRHHIQGKTAMAIASYGAFDGESLVAVMQFNRQRGTGAVELIRFCSDGRTYAGVFSKMFKRAREAEGFTEVLSFADLRYSDGGVYEKNGFTEVARIPPDYRYVKGSSTFHKSSFTKTQIAKKFDIDMSLLTEGQAMRSLGFGRIYDCGKIKYVWTA